MVAQVEQLRLFRNLLWRLLFHGFLTRRLTRTVFLPPNDVIANPMVPVELNDSPPLSVRLFLLHHNGLSHRDNLL